MLNAAAYTAVDAAETPDGRRTAWAANAGAPATLARLAAEHRFTLVHYSSEYVFDGTVEPHTEDEPLSPLGVYAQTKAAGDVAVATAPRHYVLRTSWVIGAGKNFVRTMQQLAANGVSPTVVDDQVGRLTFTDELSRATRHLLDVGAPYGTYNVSNGGEPRSFNGWAREVFRLAGRDPEDVGRVSTEEYFAGKDLAPRPLRSVMDLAKIEATGFVPEDALVALERYVAGSAGSSALAAVVVLEAVDVVLAGVLAALDLDDHQRLVARRCRSGAPGRWPRRGSPRGRPPSLAVDDAGRLAGDHDPVLGAVLVGLVGQPLVRLDDDPLHLEARPLVEDVPGTPGAVLGLPGHRRLVRPASAGRTSAR